MKFFLLKRFQRPPKLSWKDLWLTLLPILLWIAAVQARPYVISPRCVETPSLCDPKEVFYLDRLLLGYDSTPADRWSDTTQHLAGYVGVGVPAAWNLGAALLGRLSPTAALAQFGVDLVIWMQTVSWNGTVNETARLIFQRPRPYVYFRPEESRNYANYTSFYSGHTSFAAASCVSVVLMLLGRGAPLLIVIGTFLGAHVLIFLTALFRVLAGRHFLTDVLIGAIAGSMAAFLVAWFHRAVFPPGELPPKAPPLQPPP